MTALSETVVSWVEARADEMADLLTRLVAEDNENPPGRGMGRCARRLVEEMGRLDVRAELLEISADNDLEEPYVVRATVGEGTGLLYFHGHYDVVPAQSRSQFAAQRADGYVVGRG